MTTISPSANLVTLINVFTVDPVRQQQLVDVLVRATDETIRHMPGFVSANIHKSVDGARVTNYAQWRSRDDLDAMLRSWSAVSQSACCRSNVFGYGRWPSKISRSSVLLSDRSSSNNSDDCPSAPEVAHSPKFGGRRSMLAHCTGRLRFEALDSLTMPRRSTP